MTAKNQVATETPAHPLPPPELKKLMENLLDYSLLFFQKYQTLYPTVGILSNKKISRRGFMPEGTVPYQQLYLAAFDYAIATPSDFFAIAQDGLWRDGKGNKSRALIISGGSKKTFSFIIAQPYTHHAPTNEFTIVGKPILKEYQKGDLVMRV